MSQKEKHYLLISLVLFGIKLGSLVSGETVTEMINRTISEQNQKRLELEKTFDDGLVLKETFDDKNVAATIFDPKTGRKTGEMTATLKGNSDNIKIVPGIKGNALQIQETTSDPKSIASILFPIKDLVPKRGSIVLWVHTHARNYEGNKKAFGKFTIFRTGKARFRKWWLGKFGINYSGGCILVEHHKVKIPGWRQYAVTWDQKKTRIYIDGRLVGQGSSSTLLPINSLRIGPEKQYERARTIDELRIYNRILSESELRWQYLSLAKPMIIPLLSAPITKQKVDIDGKLTNAEWSQATKTVGFLDGSALEKTGNGQLTDPTATLMVQHDKKNLYIACQSRWPAYTLEARQQIMGMIGMLSSKAKERDTIGNEDDSFEIVVSPLNTDNETIYRLAVNGKNQILDEIVKGKKRFPKNSDRNWNPDWQVKTEVGEQDWIMEASIPLAAIGLTAETDKPIGFNVTRFWHLLRNGSQVWAWGARKKTPVVKPAIQSLDNLQEETGFGELKLGDINVPVVRIDQLGDLEQGKIDFRAHLINPQTNPIPLRVTLKTNTGSVFQKQKFSISASTPGLFEYTTNLNDYGDNELIFTVFDLKKKQDIFRSVWNCVRKQKLDIYTKQYPSLGLLDVVVDCGILDLNTQEKNAIQAKVELVSQTGKIIMETSAQVTTNQLKLPLDVSLIPPGNYKLIISIDENNKNLVSETIDYQKQKNPEWLGNEYGIDLEKVPYPFTPIVRNGNQLKVWGRTYNLEDSILPRQITTQGMDLLRKPVRLLLTLDAGTTIDSTQVKAKCQWNPKPTVRRHRRSTSGKLEWYSSEVSTEIRREGTAVGKIKGISLCDTFWFEYDGLLWSTISINSDHSKSTIKKALLEISLTKEFSDVINTGDYSWRSIGKIPPNGYSSGLNRCLWIGNGYGGLVSKVEQPFGEVENKKKALHVMNSEDGATIRIVVIDQPTPVSKLNSLIVSLQATPVKTRRPDYRLLTISPLNQKLGFKIGRYAGSSPFVPASVKKRYFPMVGETTWDLSKEPAWTVAREWPDFLRQKRNYRSTYLTTAKVNVQTPDGRVFRDEWSSSEGRITPSSSIISATLSSPSYRDYFVGQHMSLMKKSPFGSLYYDSLDPVPNNNSKLASIPGTLPHSLGGRDLAKRLYTMVKSRFPGGTVFNHGVVRNNMAHQSFTDFRLEGESQWPRYHKGMKNFRVSLNPARYRALLMGHNFGQPCAFDNKVRMISLADQRAAGPSLADHMFGMILLHDALGCWHGYMFPKEHTERVKNALERHNWGPNYLTIPQTYRAPATTFFVN